jgi:hypothetical protein
MFKKILIADGSEGAFKALVAALRLAHSHKAEAHMICVEEIPWMHAADISGRLAACPLSWVKRTSLTPAPTSAYDLKRTFNSEAAEYTPQQPRRRRRRRSCWSRRDSPLGP